MVNVADTAALRAEVTGEVVAPGDDAYEQLRRVTFGVGEPAVIVRSRATADVRSAVRFARDNGLVLSVRSGGHSGLGFGTNNGGVVIDLSLMDGVEVVDEGRHLVRIQAGAKWGKVANALAPYNLAISSGDTRSVGVGGLLLSGGIGWKVRKYGLTLDNLVGAEVVTADGNVVRANAEQNPDLFWAIRGGGGNFGVVTAFELEAHPTTQVFHGSITYPYEEFTDVIQGWIAAMRTTPEELTSFAYVFPGFGGPRSVVTVEFVYDGDDEAAATKAIEPLRGLGTVRDDDVKLVPYGDVLVDPPYGDGPPAGDFRPLLLSRFVPTVSPDLIAAVKAGLDENPMLTADFRSLNGAMNRVAPDATAFAHRNGEALVTSALLGMASDWDANKPKFEAYRQTVEPFAEGAYVNFMSTAERADVAMVYPSRTYQRLASVKRTYDPDNLFDQNHNVVPA